MHITNAELIAVGHIGKDHGNRLAFAFHARFNRGLGSNGTENRVKAAW